MTAITYGAARVRATKTAGRARAATPRKGPFARFVDALVESRLQHAHREIVKHAHLLPRDERGNLAVGFKNDDMPFGGW